MQHRSSLAYRKARRISRIPADTWPAPTVTSCSPALVVDTGGTPVTLTGTNFMTRDGTSLVDSVLFGSTHAASFVVNSATSISAVTPDVGVGFVAIVVNTAGGCGVLANGASIVAGPTGQLGSASSYPANLELGVP